MLYHYRSTCYTLHCDVSFISPASRLSVLIFNSSRTCLGMPSHGVPQRAVQVVEQYCTCLQDPIIAQDYPVMAKCGGCDAACLVSMTGDAGVDPMSSNVILALQNMMEAASRCGHLPARICTSGRVPCICALYSKSRC